ncbi:hypothetical protein cyc_00117 [Cyclospora cayetanensis]|uniref:Uncharacterized protein n=1 Tax=Cyclospora cayetanensis TaxID=88456 RepID=A0A1D3D4A9_9EIME|nr:hypothetical protein cyc_00117 [Cyclospora cayetanensis]
MEETQLLSALASLFSPTDPTTQRQAYVTSFRDKGTRRDSHPSSHAVLQNNLVLYRKTAVGSVQWWGPELDEWLRGWQQSVGAWEASLELLALREPPLSDDVVCFAAQTLRTKCLFDLYQLPPEAPVALICRIAAALKQHHAKAAVTQLSLALAAVSLSQQQDSPLALLLRACGLDTLQPQQNSADARLLLLLLTVCGGGFAAFIAAALGGRGEQQRQRSTSLLQSLGNACWSSTASKGQSPLIGIHLASLMLWFFSLLYPSAKTDAKALQCTRAWTPLLRHAPADSLQGGCDYTVILEDAFDVLESTSSDTAETAAAAACIAHLLKTWGRFTGAASATTAAGEGVSPLLQIAVKHSIGPLQRMLATSAAVTANGEGRGGSAAGAAPSADPETLAYAVHAVAATCRVAVPLLLRRTHVDAELQQLLETLAAAVALPRTLGLLHYRQQFPQQQQQQQHPQDEDDLTSDYEAAAFLSAEAVRFFCHLRYDIENAERQQPQQEEEVHPQSKQALIQVYRHLTDEIVKQMQLPYAQLSNEDIEEVFW